MKICISSSDKNLDSPIDPRFGRCQYFLIVESEAEKPKVIPNPGISSARGAGVAAAQILVNQGVDAIITGNIGPNAFAVLNQAGIKIYSGVFGVSCQESLKMLDQGKISQTQAPTGGFDGQNQGQGQRP